MGCTRLKTIGLTLGILAAPLAAHAESEVSAYIGFQEASHSRVRGDDGAGNDFNFLAAWEGRSFQAPPYWGLRGTYWVDDAWGIALEFTHSKIYADDETLDDNGFDTLEFTDGVNVLTLNAMRRFDLDSRWTPYLGLGLGVTIPHVEVTPTGGEETFEYQITGFGARALGGVGYAVTDNWSVFGEYNGTYTMHDAELEGGGELKTNIVTHAINLGASFSF